MATIMRHINYKVHKINVILDRTSSIRKIL